MALAKLNLDKSDVNVEIDLEKVLGGSAKNEIVRESFFQLLFDSMNERLDSGKNVNNKALKSYSKSYKDSLAYEVFGKDGTVNMQLTGDMINSVAIQKQSSKTMKIGFTGEDENNKAYGHITGMKGHKFLEGKVPKREFFGWTDKEVKSIASELRPALQEESSISDTALLALLERLGG